MCSDQLSSKLLCQEAGPLTKETVSWPRARFVTGLTCFQSDRFQLPSSGLGDWVDQLQSEWP
jgi:hypothetical protein